jgi:peptidoglycan/xylan/chitin deacetylase (PgdA/CDA1 family)
MSMASPNSSGPSGSATVPESAVQGTSSAGDDLKTPAEATVPILMYHRIASSGPAGLERFRVDPGLFEEQLSALKQSGFQTITLGDRVSALARKIAPPGKSMILTFDDGYTDFLTTALPALQRNSFAAIVYLVANRIGTRAAWDLSYGDTAPLMSWPEIREIAAQGIELGCHSLVHRPMTEMDPVEMVVDTREARDILAAGLQRSVLHFAYPHGAENVLVRDVVSALGFESAVSCHPGLSRLGDDPMALPRIDVYGGCTPEDLIAQIS